MAWMLSGKLPVIRMSFSLLKDRSQL